jgi:hypothetical protein
MRGGPPPRASADLVSWEGGEDETWERWSHSVALPLRIVLGFAFVVLGLQKIAGYFGGPGLNATAEIIASAGFTPGALWAGGGRFGRAVRRHGHGRGSPSATPTKPLSG